MLDHPTCAVQCAPPASRFPRASYLLCSTNAILYLPQHPTCWLDRPQQNQSSVQVAGPMIIPPQRPQAFFIHCSPVRPWAPSLHAPHNPPRLRGVHILTKKFRSRIAFRLASLALFVNACLASKLCSAVAFAGVKSMDCSCRGIFLGRDLRSFSCFFS
jgi:hypothetical protein